MWDYINFDSDDEDTHNPASTSTSMAEPVENTAATSTAASGAVDLGSGDADMIDPLGAPVGISPTYFDTLTMSPEPQGWNVADHLQNPIEANGMRDVFTGTDLIPFAAGVGVIPPAQEVERLFSTNPDFQGWRRTDNFQDPIGADGMPAAVDPMAFAGGVDRILTEQEIEQLASTWVPVSPWPQQQQLNSEVAPQLGTLAADPSPPPALFLPAEGGSIHPVSDIPFLPPNADLPWNGFPYSPQLDATPSTVDPSLIVQGTGDVSSLLLPPAGTYDPILPDADAYVPDAEDQAGTSASMPAFATDDFQLEPAPKRTEIAESLLDTSMDMESNDDDDGVVTGGESARHDSLPTDVINEDDDGTLDNCQGETNPVHVSDNSELSDPLSAHASSNLPADSTPEKDPDLRGEQAEETRLRGQRLEEKNRRRSANRASVRAKAPTRKTQKLLKEIEDTKGFAGSQDVEVGEGGRPVRRGVRKNYKGQE